MSFLPGIFRRDNAPAPAPAAAPAASANPGGPASAQTAGPANPAANPNTMNNTPPTVPAGGPENPMDHFTSMFQPRPADPAAPKVPTLADPLLGPIDPAAFQAQVAKANFTAKISPELAQKAMSGDAAAFMEVINSASREAFSAAAQLSHGLAETGARTAAERVTGSLDGRIRDFQIRSQNTDNAVLSHPSVAPLVGATKQMIAQANPHFSPEQVQQQTELYFTQMAEVLVKPSQEAAAASTAPKAPNFASYL